MGARVGGSGPVMSVPLWWCWQEAQSMTRLQLDDPLFHHQRRGFLFSWFDSRFSGSSPLSPPCFPLHQGLTPFGHQVALWPKTIILHDIRAYVHMTYVLNSRSSHPNRLLNNALNIHTRVRACVHACMFDCYIQMCWVAKQWRSCDAGSDLLLKDAVTQVVPDHRIVTKSSS